MATVEELNKAYQQATSTASPPAVLEEAPKSAATVQQKQTAQTQGINAMYDAQKEAQIKQLEDAYQQSMSAQQAAAQKIAPNYQQRVNELAVEYERNRRNFNQQAAGNGINTGTASQAALAQNSAYQRDYGNLRRAQADAQTEAERGIANLTAQYQSQVQAAVAQNDYQRAAALLDEYNAQYNRDLAKAEQLAQFGDFSIYAEIYGQEAADNMYSGWKAQNPQLAYNTGRITAAEYRAITGSWPAGYSAPVSYSGGGGYGGGSGYRSNVTIDGVTLTPSDVENLQRSLGVAVDGIWGPETSGAYEARQANAASGSDNLYHSVQVSPSGKVITGSLPTSR